MNQIILNYILFSLIGRKSEDLSNEEIIQLNVTLTLETKNSVKIKVKVYNLTTPI